MDFAKFKVRQLQRQIATTGEIFVDGVTFDLTNLRVASSSELIEGSAYTCTLEPEAGYYLPQVISITGTTSAYGFKYDYTTGVIYIPSDEVIGDIVITAVASEIETNIPAVLYVEKDTDTTYDGTTHRSEESFVLITVYPTRGSTVAVTYGDLTKYVTADYSKYQYDCSVGTNVFFGTYQGVTDEIETPDSGELIISGAYDSYGTTEYDNSSQASKSVALVRSHIASIVSDGAIRFIPYAGMRTNYMGTYREFTYNFNRELEYVNSQGFYNNNEYSDNILNFNNNIMNLSAIDCFAGFADTAIGSSTVGTTVNFNSVNWDKWAEGDRTALLYIGKDSNDSDSHTVSYNFDGVAAVTNSQKLQMDIDINLSEKCKRIGKHAFSMINAKSINIPKSVEKITAPAFRYFESRTISISDDNPYFCIENNIIYSKDKTKAVEYIGTKYISSGSLDIVFPEGVSEIGDFFSGDCPAYYGLSSSSTTDMEKYSFYNYSLNNVTIPSNVKKIGTYAFYGISNLIINATTPPTLGTSAIVNTPTSIIVPSGCGDAYKAAENWSTYADIIVEASA